MIKKASYLLVFVGILIVFFKVIFPVGPRVANDFPVVSTDTLKESFRLPQIWSSRSSEGLGEYSVVTLWSWPLDFLGGLLARLGLSFTTIEIFILLVPTFTLGIISIRKIFDKYKIKNSGKQIGTLLYLTNTYFLLLIDGGQLSIALTYAVFPLFFLLFIDSVGSSFKKKLISGIGVAALGFLDIRFVYILGILIFIHFLFAFIVENDRLQLIKTYVVSGIIAILVFSAFHFYWIYPLITVKATLIPAVYDTTVKNFTNLYHSLLLLQPHWYLNVFGNITNFRFEFIFIPILVFLAPVLRRKSSMVAFWVLVAVVSIFLTKGASAPFGGIYSFLYDHVPGFSLFRDSTKFFFLVALSYSVLVGIATNEIAKKIKFFPLTFVLYLIFLIYPVYMGKMTGVFSTSSYKDSYSLLAKTLSEDMSYGRIIWLPSRPPLGYSNPTHPPTDGLRIVLRRPFAIGTVGTYEMFNFLREAPFIGQIMDVASIKYLVYPYPDTRRENITRDNIDYYHNFLNQISKLPWVKDVKNFGSNNSPLPLITVKNSKDHIFLSPNLWGVLGSDRIYGDLVGIDNFDLSKNALVFLEEQKGLNKNFINTYGKIILYGKSETDLKSSLVDQNDFIFPSLLLGASPDSSGWWKRTTSDFISWRNFLQEKYKIENLDFDYGGGWAVAEGNLRLNIKDKKLQREKILLARVMKSPKGGRVSFYQQDSLVGTINTKIEKPEKVVVKLTGAREVDNKYFGYDLSNFEWEEVGVLGSDSDLTIATNGELNVVNSLATISLNDWNILDKQISKLEGEGRILNWSKLGSVKKQLFSSRDNGGLSYTYVSPTKYKVEVKGLKSPEVISFSEGYNNLWSIGGVKSFPLYSLINGFVVTHDGSYFIEFTPQKHIEDGFKVSLFLILIALLIFTSLK